MLKMVQSLFGQKPAPVGVDFGSETLRMAQVELVEGEYRLAAASCIEIPMGARKNVTARMHFLSETCRPTFQKGNFSGRQIVIGIPAPLMHVVHLRVPKMDDESLLKALPWELKGKVPIEPSKALLRHVIAGEIFQDQETKLELIVMAVQRDTVSQFIRIAENARLEVIGLEPEPKAILDCFRSLFRRKADMDPTTMYIDIGFSATRVMVSCGEDLQVLRFIPIGGDQFNYAASVALKVPVHEARRRRIQQAQTPGLDGGNGAMAAIDPILDPTTAKRLAERGIIEEACRDPLERLLNELEPCRRYHEATFPNRPINRLVFVGGEALQTALCQQIAKRLGIAAQLGDPMVRLGRMSRVPVESGVDVSKPQPAWAVAAGLSIGRSAV